MSLFDRKGQVALITGSSKGIGRAIAERMAQHGARVVIGSRKQHAIRTGFARALWEDPDNLQRRMADTPLRRIGEPDEIAGAAVFLAAASGRFMTGQTMVIDGARTC